MCRHQYGFGAALGAALVEQERGPSVGTARLEMTRNGSGGSLDRCGLGSTTVLLEWFFCYVVLFDLMGRNRIDKRPGAISGVKLKAGGRNESRMAAGVVGRG